GMALRVSARGRADADRGGAAVPLLQVEEVAVTGSRGTENQRRVGKGGQDTSGLAAHQLRRAHAELPCRGGHGGTGAVYHTKAQAAFAQPTQTRHTCWPPLMWISAPFT